MCRKYYGTTFLSPDQTPANPPFFCPLAPKFRQKGWKNGEDGLGKQRNAQLVDFIALAAVISNKRRAV